MEDKPNDPCQVGLAKKPKPPHNSYTTNDVCNIMKLQEPKTDVEITITQRDKNN